MPWRRCPPIETCQLNPCLQSHTGSLNGHIMDWERLHLPHGHLAAPAGQLVRAVGRMHTDLEVTLLSRSICIRLSQVQGGFVAIAARDVALSVTQGS